MSNTDEVKTYLNPAMVRHFMYLAESLFVQAHVATSDLEKLILKDVPGQGPCICLVSLYEIVLAKYAKGYPNSAPLLADWQEQWECKDGVLHLIRTLNDGYKIDMALGCDGISVYIDGPRGPELEVHSTFAKGTQDIQVTCRVVEPEGGLFCLPNQIYMPFLADGFGDDLLELLYENRSEFGYSPLGAAICRHIINSQMDRVVDVEMTQLSMLKDPRFMSDRSPHRKNIQDSIERVQYLVMVLGEFAVLS